MAEEFHTGICSGNWWNAMRSSSSGSAGFDGSAVAVTAAVSSVSCSTGIDDMVSYGWTGVEIEKTRSCEDSSMSGSPVTYLDGHKAVASVPMVTGSLLIDPSLPIVDWNQALLRNSGRTHQGGFIHHPMLQEELSSKPYFHQEPSTTLEPNQIVQMGVVDDMSQAYMIDNHHNNSGNSFQPGVSSVSNYGGPPAVYLQGLFDPQQQSPAYDNHSHSYHTALSSNETNIQSPLPSWSKFPQFFKPSQHLLPQLKQQQQQQQQQQAGQLHFSNNTAFWNAPATTAVVDMKQAGIFFPTMNHQFFSSQNFEQKQSSTGSTVTSRSVSESGRDSSSLPKKGGNEPSFKKPRVETPSPLPTFKVRKEKLSDRVTALQQLVSPFGKTDTASVLFEAIEYIKYLHDQVNALSSPYLKNGHPMQPQQQQGKVDELPNYMGRIILRSVEFSNNSEKSKDGTAERPKQDLRSRGLCLVPIASTFPVANEPLADFFTPSFGGSYR